ncbi:hypothetical protein DENIS_3375 [Desulfonema ishimotonii]|uniref:Uncharacterized protein n=1 Tax=Desulfonema ishimotonii TaxID=45657 RepID=A0A401FZP3_9BACT|nr:hypothetical protein [Desulfonema ishimotonii]GBC62403.1 hypothetical protein DENIS_3375 [Desulfonema ishimotonii]
MKFIFSCPETGQIFETDAFKMIENKGITEDESGNRVLDAKVELETPCPFCGKQHVFHASELLCPFSAGK